MRPTDLPLPSPPAVWRLARARGATLRGALAVCAALSASVVGPASAARGAPATSDGAEAPAEPSPKAPSTSEPGSDEGLSADPDSPPALSPGAPAPDVATSKSAGLGDSIVEDLLVLDYWVFAQQATRVRGVVQPSPGSVLLDRDVMAFLDAGATLWDGRLTATTSVAVFVDLDDQTPSPELSSVHDSVGPTDVLVTNLEARYSGTRYVPRASVGRLTILDGWPLIIDGAAVTVRPLAFLRGDRFFGVAGSELFFSAGRTVHFYDLDPSLFEDWAASAGARLRLFGAVAAEVDYRLLVEDSARAFADHDYGGALVVGFGQYWQSRAYVRGLNLSLARAGAQARAAYPEWGLYADARLDAQTVPLDIVHERANPYFLVLGRSEPFVRGMLEVGDVLSWSRIGVGVRAGVQARVRVAGSDGPFNRTYGRGYASLELFDIWLKGLYVTTTAEYAFADTLFGDGVLAASGSVGYRTRFIKAELATDYQRFKYTYYRDAMELADVRTVTASATLPLVWGLSVRGAYRAEVFDRVVHTATVSLVENFSGFGLRPGSGR